MAQAKKLPDCDALVGHVNDGLSNLEIADIYGVTQEAVRQSLAKCGVRRPRQRPSHAYYIPWRLRGDHVGDVVARRLRAYSKRMQGRPLKATEETLLEQWMKWMDGGNSYGVPLSVHYDRTDDQGFYFMPRQDGDRDYIAPPKSD